MRIFVRLLTLAGLCFLASACSIIKTVEPVKGAPITGVCVLDNPQILMDEFQPEMIRQIQAKGIPARVYTGERPTECSHYLEYTASWRWDMAMYLTYTEMRVYDARGLAGQAIYDARRGAGRLDKFGKTADKIRPLIDELLADTNPNFVPEMAPADAEGGVQQGAK